MIKQQKPARISITLKPELLKQMKDYLQEVNGNETLKYVSQSEFISVAISDLLLKEEQVNG